MCGVFCSIQQNHVECDRKELIGIVGQMGLKVNIDEYIQARTARIKVIICLSCFWLGYQIDSLQYGGWRSVCWKRYVEGFICISVKHDSSYVLYKEYLKRFLLRGE